MAGWGQQVRISVRYFAPGSLLAVQFVSGFSVALKDAVKAVPGARWDPGSRSWMVPETAAPALSRALAGTQMACDDASQRIFDAMAPSTLSEATREVLRPASVPPAASAPVTAPSAARSRERRALAGYQRATLDEASEVPAYDSVSSLHARVAAALAGEFARQEWVMGVVTDLATTQQGAIYLTLSDAEERGAGANLSVAIFGPAAQRIRRKLADAGLTLDVGMSLALGGRVGVYPARSSIQLLADDVDPRVSRGEVELRRERVVAELRAAKLSGKNARVPLTSLPRRIAVVTSEGAEAWHDLLRALRRAEVGATIDLYPVRVQGTQLEPSVLRALAAVERREDLDLVVVIRGGGAANELAWWDNFRVAEAIANLRHPVLVGIGHQRDETALHEVARYEATPTSVGERIARLWTEARDAVRACEEIVERVSKRRLDEAGRGLAISGERFRALALRRLGWERSLVERELPRALSQAWERARAQRALALSHALADLDARAQRRLRELEGQWARAHERSLSLSLAPIHARETGRLQVLQQALVRATEARLERERLGQGICRRAVEAHDPRPWLARGWIFAKNEAGALVRGVAEIAPADTLTLYMRDGEARVRVESLSSPKREE